MLELSKRRMYDIFYNVLKKNYNENVSLIYMDTDSFFLEFKNMDVFNELSKSPLKEHMDLSNFPQDHNLFSNEHKGKLGYLKSETAATPIKEIIALSPKCYSILLDDKTVKSAAKGVPMTEKKNFLHEHYENIHNQSKISYSAATSNIT